MRVGFHVHIVQTSDVETMFASSERPTESNDRSAPSQIVHALRSSKHRLIPAFIVGHEILIEYDFQRPVQVFTSPGVLTRVRRGESGLASKRSNVIHDNVLVVSLILWIYPGDALADGSPCEPRFLLVWKEDHDSTYTSAGRIRCDVFEAPAHQLVGVCVGLEALG